MASFESGFGHSRLRRSIITFFGLLVLGFVYQCLIMYDALAKRNTIQLIGLCIYAACLSVYAILQVDQTRRIIIDAKSKHNIAEDNDVWTAMRPLVVAIATLTGLYFLTICFLSYKLYDEFAWSIFAQLHADYRMKRKYFTFQACSPSQLA